MENEFLKVMSERSDEQLETILTAERKSYKPDAIEAAEIELEKRNISIDTPKYVNPIDEKIDKKKVRKQSKSRKLFNDRYGELSESDIQKEILLTQRQSLQKLERIRKNTSNMVWWLIVIPFIVAIILFLF